MEDAQRAEARGQRRSPRRRRRPRSTSRAAERSETLVEAAQRAEARGQGRSPGRKRRPRSTSRATRQRDVREGAPIEGAPLRHSSESWNPESGAASRSWRMRSEPRHEGRGEALDGSAGHAQPVRPRDSETYEKGRPPCAPPRHSSESWNPESGAASRSWRMRSEPRHVGRTEALDGGAGHAQPVGSRDNVTVGPGGSRTAPTGCRNLWRSSPGSSARPRR